MTELSTLDRQKENKEILKQYRYLLRAIKPQLKKGDKKMIRQAFEVAMEAHKDMRRKSGEPYILHPLAVAQITADEIGLGPISVVCALLHDVVEDTELTLDDIKRDFGSNVAKIIDGLTKISGVFDLQTSAQAENFRKLLLTLTDDVRVILIKLADRTHNMRTMSSMPRHKQLKIASETAFLYAPLAHRLGLYAIKSELEDLSMKYTEAEVYKMIAEKLNETKRERSRYINEFIRPLKARLNDTDLKFKIFGRPKSIHSIWNKMKNKGVEFEEVYDLFAVRVLIDVKPENEKSECWRVYSMVTDTYRPNPGRLRDWVSTPKANGYEALHITVMGPKGKWVEVQIRTERMDEIAEKGYAAHWKYKEDSADSMLDDWLTRIRELLQNPESNALDFVNDFKLNLFSDEIYVFTPKGQLRILPKGSTSLDFAFDIHTDIGEQCIGAKVNHKLVPLSYKLKNGDQVEIITSRKQKPNEDWLNLVVTGKAKAKIKSSLKEEKRIIGEDGKELLRKKLKNMKTPWSETLVHEIASYLNFKTSLDLFFNIAQGNVDLSKLDNIKIVKGQIIDNKKNDIILEKPTEESVEDSIRNKLQKNAELLIFDESADNIDHKFAPCCNPIPGDDVFGFITVNEGIKIHKTSCPNAVQLMSNYGYRIVKTKWTRQHGIAFLTEVKVSGLDDVGIMNKITTIISGELKLNMQSLSIDGKDGIFEGLIKVYVNNTKELDELIDKLKSVDGILSVNRM